MTIQKSGMILKERRVSQMDCSRDKLEQIPINIIKFKENGYLEGSMTSKPELSYKITVEPLIFTVLFITACTNGVTIDLIERNLFCVDYNRSSCESWSHVSNRRTDVQLSQQLNSDAAKLNMIIRLVQGTCPFLISLFVGPWTDKNGRKPFMSLTLAGYFSFSALWAVLSLFPKISAYWFILPSVPLSLSGGQLALYLCCYCYISDVTLPANRTIRFSFLYSCSLMGSLAGNCFVIVIDKMIKMKDLSYLVIFLVCSLVALTGLVYSLTCIEETVISNKKSKDFIFNLEFARSVATSVFNKPPKQIVITLLTVFMLFFDITIKKGEKVILYLVGLNQYAWTLSHYNLFSASIILVSAISSSVVSVLLKKTGWKNLNMILFASVMVLSTEILRAFSTSEAEFWVMSCINTLATLTGPAVTAEISTLASKEDLGKIYALSALIDSLVPFLATSLYSEIYRLLVSSNRTLYVYFVSSACALTIGSSALIIQFLKDPPPDKTELDNPTIISTLENSEDNQR